MVDGLVREEDTVLDEHGGAPQDEGREEVDVDGIPGAVQLPAGGRDGLGPNRAEKVLWCPLSCLEPSPGITAGDGHKVMEKLACSKIRKDRVVLCLGLLRDKGTPQKPLESPNLQHKEVCKART